jgi:NTE family protein
VDLSSADVIVGTSAGSIVGSHVANGTDLQALAATTPAPAGAEAAAVPAASLEVILSALAPLFDPHMIAARTIRNRQAPAW